MPLVPQLENNILTTQLPQRPQTNPQLQQFSWTKKKHTDIPSSEILIGYTPEI